MNELLIPAKFLIWVVGVVVALGLVGQLGFITYSAAEIAIETHQQDQLSYGKFSRQLWSKPKKKKE